MNNLHRELAPVSGAAWASMEEEARRTFVLHLAGRRVADVRGPAGATLAAVGTGHLTEVASPAAGVTARLRRSQPLAEWRVPFTVDRQEVDDVERGAGDPDWQPVRDAARAMASAEDRAVFEGYEPAGIVGIRAGSPHPALTVPADVRDFPGVASQAAAVLRQAGAGGPYSLVLGGGLHTAVAGTLDHGMPVAGHLARMLGGEIVWAPAIEGAFVLSARGGDYELHLGQDLSIGYLSHDAASVRLYFQESLTFLVRSGEAGVALAVPAPAGAPGESRRRG